MQARLGIPVGSSEQRSTAFEKFLFLKSSSVQYISPLQCQTRCYGPVLPLYIIGNAAICIYHISITIKSSKNKLHFNKCLIWVPVVNLIIYYPSAITKLSETGTCHRLQVGALLHCTKTYNVYFTSHQSFTHNALDIYLVGS
jgi:hypothetical protein